MNTLFSNICRHINKNIFTQIFYVFILGQTAVGIFKQTIDFILMNNIDSFYNIVKNNLYLYFTLYFIFIYIPLYIVVIYTIYSFVFVFKSLKKVNSDKTRNAIKYSLILYYILSMLSISYFRSLTPLVHIGSALYRPKIIELHMAKHNLSSDLR